MKVSCLLTLALALTAFAQNAPESIDQLLSRARSGNQAALEALSNVASPEARSALASLSERPTDPGYNSALKIARSKAGLVGGLLSLAGDMFFGSPSSSSDALGVLIKMGGPEAIRILQIGLDDDSGGGGDGDVQYLSNAQNALLGLQELVTLPGTGRAQTLNIPIGRKPWHEWFETHEQLLSKTQFDDMAATAVFRAGITDFAVLALMAPDRFAEFLKTPAAAEVGPNVQVLFEAFRVAHGLTPCGDSIIRRIQSRPISEQRLIVKTLGLARTPIGAWILCRLRSSILDERAPSAGSREVRELTESLLSFWKRDGTRMVPTYGEPSRGGNCLELADNRSSGCEMTPR